MRTAAAIIVFVMSGPLSAQWMNSPAPGIPRLPDGKPNPAAPAPKTPDGKPDLSGIWLTRGGYTGNIAKDLKPGEVSLQPWAEAFGYPMNGARQQARPAARPRMGKARMGRPGWVRSSSQVF